MVSREKRVSSDNESNPRSGARYRDRSPRRTHDPDYRDRRDRHDSTSDDEDRYRNRRRHRQRSRDGPYERERPRRERSSEPPSPRENRRQPYRSRSRSDDRRRDHERRRRSRSPRHGHSKKALPPQDESFRANHSGNGGGGAAVPEKEKPNFRPTGLLAKEANTVAGTTTVLKYHEPAEARKPGAKEQWRMYVFKKKDLLDTVYLYQRSCWLVGRDANVTDLRLEHPSVSKQHAVVQFRHTTVTNEYGDKTNHVKPYLIDLESANGTMLNGKEVGTSRFIELVDGDVVRFGESEREYVMMLPTPDK